MKCTFTNVSFNFLYQKQLSCLMHIPNSNYISKCATPVSSISVSFQFQELWTLHYNFNWQKVEVIYINYRPKSYMRLCLLHTKCQSSKQLKYFLDSISGCKLKCILFITIRIREVHLVFDYEFHAFKLTYSDCKQWFVSTQIWWSKNSLFSNSKFS